MTELELMELLGEINGGYIQQAEAFRQGRLRIVKKKRPLVTALKILSTAAMLAVILGAGYLGLRGQVKRENQETANETMVMRSDETAEEPTADTGEATAERPKTDAEKVTPELLMREASVNLTIWEGNSKYPVPADLFIGEGYSLYIPREGWIHETIDYHGTTADRWVMAEETPEEFARNTMIDTQNRQQLQKLYDEKYQTRLTILFRPGMDNQAIRDWVTEVNPDWNLTQNAKGSLFGDTASVTFLPTETGVFVCIQETFASQPEEWGILGAICESFSGWPSELTGYLTGVEDRPAEISVRLTRYSDATRCWEEYTLPFTRYRAYGYSTYIPKEGFVFQKTQEEARFGGCSGDVWTCEKDENVWFGVVKLGTSGYSDAIRWGLLLDGYDLYEDQSGGISGQSKDGTQFLSVSFRQKDFYGIYAVMCHYPVGEADDLAGVVNVMANQFQAE